MHLSLEPLGQRARTQAPATHNPHENPAYALCQKTASAQKPKARGSMQTGVARGCLRRWVGARMLVASAASSSAQAQKRRPGPVDAAITRPTLRSTDPKRARDHSRPPPSGVRYVAMATRVCSIFASRERERNSRAPAGRQWRRQPPTQSSQTPAEFSHTRARGVTEHETSTRSLFHHLISLTSGRDSHFCIPTRHATTPAIISAPRLQTAKGYRISRRKRPKYQETIKMVSANADDLIYILQRKQFWLDT